MEAHKDTYFAAWREFFSIPINDPRARTVTYQQARLDLETFAARRGPSEEEDRDAWFKEEARKAEERKAGKPKPDLAGAPSAEDGNRDRKAAMARLQAIMRKQQPEATGNHSVGWEPVDLDEDDD